MNGEPRADARPDRRPVWVQAERGVINLHLCAAISLDGSIVTFRSESGAVLGSRSLRPGESLEAILGLRGGLA